MLSPGPKHSRYHIEVHACTRGSAWQCWCVIWEPLVREPLTLKVLVTTIDALGHFETG